jgi:hypothetical protein
MKLITSLSISAFVLMPAIAFAENSPSSTGTVSQPNVEQPSDVSGQKFYPDWGAVKKDWGAVKRVAAPPSQNNATAKPNEAKDQPGLMEKAKEKAKELTGTNDSSAKDQPGLVEKAKETAERLMGTITGTSPNENESNMSAGKPKILGTLTGVIEIDQSAADDVVTNTTAALQGRTSIPITIKGELKIDKPMR